MSSEFLWLRLHMPMRRHKENLPVLP
uniref:Uncharacterized protein n=1 Tax=Arundo donax TaxID=35708 RepID=A0A0A9GI76_ARUDO